MRCGEYRSHHLRSIIFSFCSLPLTAFVPWITNIASDGLRVKSLGCREWYRKMARKNRAKGYTTPRKTNPTRGNVWLRTFSGEVWRLARVTPFYLLYFRAKFFPLQVRTSLFDLADLAQLANGVKSLRRIFQTTFNKFLKNHFEKLKKKTFFSINLR